MLRPAQVAKLAREGIKPGWVRVNFNYFIDEATFQYIVDAVHHWLHRTPPPCHWP